MAAIVWRAPRCRMTGDVLEGGGGGGGGGGGAGGERAPVAPLGAARPRGAAVGARLPVEVGGGPVPAGARRRGHGRVRRGAPGVQSRRGRARDAAAVPPAASWRPSSAARAPFPSRSRRRRVCVPCRGGPCSARPPGVVKPQRSGEESPRREEANAIRDQADKGEQP